MAITAEDDSKLKRESVICDFLKVRWPVVEQGDVQTRAWGHGVAHILDLFHRPARPLRVWRYHLMGETFLKSYVLP